MQRINVLQILDPESGIDHGEWIEKMGSHVSWVFSAEDAIAALHGSSEVNAVIIDGFSTEIAEMIACEIRMEFEDMYIGIMNDEIKHREHNAYATEVIPQAFMQLKDALIHRFHEKI